jgi:hypothetical protein
MTGKLGKLAPKFNKRTLKFSKYLAASPTVLPAPPPKSYWEYKIPPDAWQMFGNDTIGDCTCACIAHMLMNVTAHTGNIVVPTLQDVISVYSAVSGYDPSTGDNDNGAAITDVLAYWQTTGIASHKILGWASLDASNIQHVEQGNYIFGGVDIGFNVPQSAMDQANAHEAWDVVPDDGGIIGGHSVPIFGYGSQGATCITWGALQQLSWDFFSKYTDEAYVCVTQDWLNQADGLAPSGFDLAALQADLKAIAV